MVAKAGAEETEEEEEEAGAAAVADGCCRCSGEEIAVALDRDAVDASGRDGMAAMLG